MGKIVENYEMLFGEINVVPADYKISLNAEDEANKRADFLWNKLSSKNKIGDPDNQLDTDKNLIPCELKNNKIVLSPVDGSGDEGTNVIAIDTYKIIESNAEFRLASIGHNDITLVCFPFQFAVGQIKSIIIQPALRLGVKLEKAWVGIYANDKPGIIGARKLWSNGPNENFNADGLLSFMNGSTCTGPMITGYTGEGVDRKPNTFFYVLFGAQADNDGGYRLLGMNNETGFELLNTVNDVKAIGSVRLQDKNEPFHNTFDYTLNDNIKSLIIPHITFEMIV